ncbi:nitrilase [Rhodococcoides trifolii]|uniref:Nitrilase n=1 Tax=Rhodococcoides trifolii TaxID=908250 RepID=A0A917G322_9NOCA|nr:carbon-nitrogen hydrolase family protein [Rhodococcus trifolii]GGG20334.1 nitrilase [Rhodococcus trifolii]
MTTVSLFQGPDSPDGIVDAIDAAARAAAAAGARILVCPEMSATGYNIGHLIVERAEPADGPIAAAMADIARANDTAIVYGYPELADGAVYNSVRVIDRDGTALLNYRKTHLFGDLDRDHFTPGDTLVAQFDLDGIRCGVLVCYDVEFPEAVRAHADSGTEWLIVPTGLMTPYDLVATQVVPARAYESQMFVTYVNRCGVENGLEYVGLTCAIAPDGTELARAGRGEQLLTFDLDPAVVASSRGVNTHLDDRRPDLYEQERTR